MVRATLSHATAAALLASLAVAAIVALGGLLEARRPLPPPAARTVHRAVSATAIAALVAVLAAGLVVAGDPVARVEHAWHSFKGGYSEGNNGGNRLLSGLGSNRYDFYRVALDEFEAHPLVGIGADNFQQQYLRLGRSAETPRYPHSVELRTLTQTGLIGLALALAGLLAALLAAGRAIRGPDRLGASVAAAALAGFGYWVVHGSVDWFWEFAGLGAPAFAMLGLACSLAPRGGGDAEAVASPAESPPSTSGPGGPVAAGSPGAGTRRAPDPRRVLAVAGFALLILAGVLAFAGPWLSQLEVQNAARIWPRAPASAYSRLDQAAELDPLSDEAYLVAGSIALRFGDLTRADRAFADALARVPDDAYATLERGAIASTRGNRSAALAELSRAAALDPRDPLTREALLTVRRGGRVSVEELNRAILRKAQELA